MAEGHEDRRVARGVLSSRAVLQVPPSWKALFVVGASPPSTAGKNKSGQNWSAMAAAYPKALARAFANFLMQAADNKEE